MATSKISKVTPNEFPVSTDYAAINDHGATGSLRVMKWGKIVIISGGLMNKATGTNLTLATVPSGYRPAEDTWLSVSGYEGPSNYRGEAEIKTNGNIVVNNEQINGNMKISGAWITNE